MAALTLCLWLPACAGSSQDLTPPVSFSFEMQQAGIKLNKEIKIAEYQTYAFDFQYYFKEKDQADRARAWKLAGGEFLDSSGKWANPGAKLNFKLTVIQKTGEGDKPAFEGTISNPHLTSWGTSLNANLANVRMHPGVYQVILESLTDAPEFQGQNVGIQIIRAYLGK